MIYLEAEKTTQKYASRQDIAKIFGYKDPSKLLVAFKKHADRNPDYYKPVKPYIKNKGMSPLYNVYAFAHYFQNRDLVEVNRAAPFKEDLKELKEVY